MKNLIFLCMIAAFAFACTEKKTVEKSIKVFKDENGHIVSKTIETKDGKIPGMPMHEAGNVNLVIKKDHIFSDPTKPDHFKLDLKGSSILQSNVHFTITNPMGQIIYKDSMTSADLEASLVYEYKNTPTERQREDFIKKRLDEFFDKKYFSTPAISAKDKYNPGFGDETAWNAIKDDKNAVGFSYLVGKEKGRRIAYSKLNKKVMLVGNFGG